MNSPLLDIALAVGLIAVLVVTVEVGYRAGRRAADEGEPRGGAQIGSIQGALLGLLGLLLAFSFAAAGSRFLERQDLITQEANAIGTAYLRADLLNEPSRSQLQSTIARYTQHRIDTAHRLRYGLTDSDLAEVNAFHRQMWSAALAGVNERPQTMQTVLPSMNEVIDIHSTRIAAGLKHTPAPVMALLLACSILSIAVIGYGMGLNGRRHPAMTIPLAVLIGASLWITFDLDHPRAGLLQLNDEPLKALQFEANTP